MTRYQHTQIGHAIVWSLLAIILIVNGGLMDIPRAATSCFDHAAGLPYSVLQT